jgi:hypothetical protein
LQTVGSGLETVKKNIFTLKSKKSKKERERGGILKTYSTSLTSRFIRKVWFNTPPLSLFAAKLRALRRLKKATPTKIWY